MSKKKVCVNCHFLMLKVVDITHNERMEHVIFLDDENRDKLRNGDFEQVSKIGEYGKGIFLCYHEVWSEQFRVNPDDRPKNINETSRKNCSYFMKYRPDMMFPTAVKVQKNERELKQMSINWTLTIIGLAISLIALFIAILAYFKEAPGP